MRLAALELELGSEPVSRHANTPTDFWSFLE
jgi:hypothetical protein